MNNTRGRLGSYLGWHALDQMLSKFEEQAITIRRNLPAMTIKALKASSPNPLWLERDGFACRHVSTDIVGLIR